jgi:hypothetical protein
MLFVPARIRSRARQKGWGPFSNWYKSRGGGQPLPPSNGCSPLGRRMITRTGAGRCRLMHGGYGHGAGTSSGRLRVFSSIQAAMSLGPKRFGPSDAPGPGTPATQRAAAPRAHPPPGARSPGRFRASPVSPGDGSGAWVVWRRFHCGRFPPMAALLARNPLRIHPETFHFPY